MRWTWINPSCQDLYQDMIVHTERSPPVVSSDRILVWDGDVPYMVSEEGSWPLFVKASWKEKADSESEWLLKRFRLANGSPEGTVRESRSRPQGKRPGAVGQQQPQQAKTG